MRDDGRIVLAGWRGNTHGPNLVVAQLDASGDPIRLERRRDRRSRPPPGQSGITATALAIGADGSVFVAGDSGSGSVGCCLLLREIRYGDGRWLRRSASAVRSRKYLARLFLRGRDALHVRPDARDLFGTTAFPFGEHPEEHRTQFILIRANTDGTLDTRFGSGGWRGYTIADPSGTGQSGDYDQLHAIVAREDSVLLFGRTFFEDNSNGLDYISMVRTTFAPLDLLFANGFE